jgi:CRISPR-associated protein Cas2
MLVTVAYDIPDDGRRTRLHRALKHYGTPVQESVFECFLSPREIVNLKKMIGEVIDERIDQVRYYYLCEACSRRIEATMASRNGSDPTAVII